MIEAIQFNESGKFACNYEGGIPLGRTGTVKTSSLKSLCNALLLSCSKKFILEDEVDKMISIEKLETDFKIVHRQSEMFTQFYTDLNDTIYQILDDFYKFIDNDINAKFEEKSELRKLISVLFDDDDNNDTKNKIDTFMVIKTIFSLNDLKKILRLRKRSMEPLPELKTAILKDVKHFLKFQDLVDESHDKSRFIKLNTLLLVDSIFDIASEYLTVPDFNPEKADNIFFKIATTHFQCNIFCIDSRTEAIQFFTDYNPKLKTIILLSFDNGEYFEIIGKLRQSNIINRQFLPYEDVVQSILYHTTTIQSII